VLDRELSDLQNLKSRCAEFPLKMDERAVKSAMF